jgi:hypothetical protein
VTWHSVLMFVLRAALSRHRKQLLFHHYLHALSVDPVLLPAGSFPLYLYARVRVTQPNRSYRGD